MIKVERSHFIESLYDYLVEKGLATRRDKITEIIRFEGNTSYRTISGIDLTKKGWKYLVISLLILLILIIVL